MAEKTIDDALCALQSGDPDTAGDIARAVIQECGFWKPEAIHILASIALVQQKPATAIALIGRVLQQRERAFLAALEGRLHQTLGRALLAVKQYEAARSAFSISVRALPEEAAAHAGLGEAYLALRKPEKAVEALKRAVALAPKQAALWGILAYAHDQKGNLKDAEQAWERVVSLAPNDRAAWANYGGALFKIGQWDTAESALEKALEQGCYTPQTLNNMGLVQSALGHMEKACQYFEKAAYQSPDDPSIVTNRNAALYDMGQGRAAENLLTEFEKRTGSLPAKAQFNRAALFLERGEWQAGWRAFEARRHLFPSHVTQPLLDVPLWTGESGDEPIALHAEQGLGDTVQFLRFLPEILKRRPVRLQFPQEIQDLIQHHYPSLDKTRILASDGPVSAQQSLLSVPYILGMEEAPITKSYLSSSAVPEQSLIGVCWAGNGAYAFNRRRSIPQSLLEPLRHVPKARFMSLQQRAEAPEWMEQPPLSSLSELSDAVGRCALVLSVDTLVAHMAGAQGRPLWLLNRKGGDWRWKQSFWYPEVKQFQANIAAPPHQSWPEVIMNVCSSLEEELSPSRCA